MPEVWCANYGELDGGKLLKLLHKVFRNASEETRGKPVIRSAWDGHPDNLFVELDPQGWVPYEPWMDKHFEIRLDPFTCDPYPEDLPHDLRALRR